MKAKHLAVPRLQGRGAVVCPDTPQLLRLQSRCSLDRALKGALGIDLMRVTFYVVVLNRGTQPGGRAALCQEKAASHLVWGSRQGHRLSAQLVHRRRKAAPGVPHWKDKVGEGAGLKSETKNAEVPASRVQQQAPWWGTPELYCHPAGPKLMRVDCPNGECPTLQV